MPILEITIPANTKETSPLIRTVDVGIQDIQKIIISIPDGHNFLARLSIRSRGLQLIPGLGSSESWVRGNNNRFEFYGIRRLEGPPFQLSLVGWNEDDTYEHLFMVEVQ